MRRKTFVLSIALTIVMLVSSFALAQEETEFSGDFCLGYVNMKDTEEVKYEDAFSIDFLELMVKKSVGSFGVFVNYRIGDFRNRLGNPPSDRLEGTADPDSRKCSVLNRQNYYLYEGWISYRAPKPLGTMKLGLVPVPFGIFQNGLYYPKGILFDRNWMWNYNYGASYEGTFQISDTIGIDTKAGYFNREDLSDELAAFDAGEGCLICTGERDIISGRFGVNVGIEGLLELKVGGSGQIGKLERENQEKADDKFGYAGDITISPKNIPIPVTLMGEFVNYSFGKADTLKGNTFMAQIDITPVQNMGTLDNATLSFHVGMDIPKEGERKTNLIGQLLLQLDKQFQIYTQIFGDMTEGEDKMTGQGLRVWFMYLF